MRMIARILFLVLTTLGSAQAESSSQVFGTTDFLTLEAIAKRAPGFAGITRVVQSGDQSCLRIGTSLPIPARQTLQAVQASGIFGTRLLCQDVESVPYSVRTLIRVARQIEAEFPDLAVSIDTGLNQVLVRDTQTILSRLPSLAPYLTSEREHPAYRVSLDIQGGVPLVRIHNSLKRRIAVNPFCGAPLIDVLRGSTLLRTQPRVVCALGDQPTLLRPGETLVLKGVASTRLNSLPSGRYTLRLTTEDQPSRTVQIDWVVK